MYNYRVLVDHLDNINAPVPIIYLIHFLPVSHPNHGIYYTPLSSKKIGIKYKARKQKPWKLDGNHVYCAPAHNGIAQNEYHHRTTVTITIRQKQQQKNQNEWNDAHANWCVRLLKPCPFLLLLLLQYKTCVMLYMRFKEPAWTVVEWHSNSKRKNLISLLRVIKNVPLRICLIIYLQSDYTLFCQHPFPLPTLLQPSRSATWYFLHELGCRSCGNVCLRVLFQVAMTKNIMNRTTLITCPSLSSLLQLWVFSKLFFKF